MHHTCHLQTILIPVVSLACSTMIKHLEQALEAPANDDVRTMGWGRRTFLRRIPRNETLTKIPGGNKYHSLTTQFVPDLFDDRANHLATFGDAVL